MGRKNRLSQEIEAVKLIEEGSRSARIVSDEYGIRENTLCKWKRQYAVNPEGVFAGAPTGDNAKKKTKD